MPTEQIRPFTYPLPYVLYPVTIYLAYFDIVVPAKQEAYARRQANKSDSSSVCTLRAMRNHTSKTNEVEFVLPLQVAMRVHRIGMRFVSVLVTSVLVSYHISTFTDRHEPVECLQNKSNPLLTHCPTYCTQ